jgi:hypothetical protein
MLYFRGARVAPQMLKAVGCGDLRCDLAPGDLERRGTQGSCTPCPRRIRRDARPLPLVNMHRHAGALADLPKLVSVVEDQLVFALSVVYAAGRVRLAWPKFFVGDALAQIIWR